MNRLSQHRIINIIAILALLVFISSGFFTYVQTQNSDNANQMVEHTHTVIEQASNAVLQLSKIDTEINNYLLANDSSGLPISFTPLKETIKNIKNLTLDNPQQVENLKKLDNLLNERITISEKVLTLAKTKGIKAALEARYSEYARAIRNDIYQSINLIMEEEFKLLNKRNAIYTQAAENNKILTAVTAIVGLIFLLLSFILLNIHLKRRDNAEKKLLATEKELIKANHMLRLNEKRYELAIHGGKTGLWDWDVNTQNVYYSDQFKQMLGYNEDEFPDLLSSWENSLHPDDHDRIMKAINNHLENNTPYTVEYRLKLKSGSYEWFQASGESIFDDYNKPARMSGTLININERKEIENIKNNFISIVSHELRTPLTSIFGSLALLLSDEKVTSNPDTQQLLTIAKQNSERLITLINDILDTEKFEAGKIDFNITQININKLVEKSIELNTSFANEYNVKLQQLDNVENVIINGDQDRLMQVMTNLISNAVKFSPKNGTVNTIISTYDNIVRVSIQDEGEGIPKEFEAHIFEKFSQADATSTRKNKGSGLGLNISKTIIEKLGGKLKFNSSSKGTTFYFELPIAEELIEQHRNLFSKVTDSRKYNILICEHDENTATLIKLLMEKQGFNAFIINSTESLEDILARENIHALIFDVTIPHIDTFAYLSGLRKKYDQIKLPIVLIALKQSENVQLLGSSLNVIDCIEKPIDIEKLTHSIITLKNKLKLKKFNILHVEDDKALSEVIIRTLKDEATITNAETLLHAKDYLLSDNYDAVILDLSLPDGFSLNLFPIICRKHIPIIIYSAYDLPKAYKEYVSDALLKSKHSNQDLVDAIHHALNITKEKAYADKTVEKNHDSRG